MHLSDILKGATVPPLSPSYVPLVGVLKPDSDKSCFRFYPHGIVNGRYFLIKECDIDPTVEEVTKNGTDCSGLETDKVYRVRVKAEAQILDVRVKPLLARKLMSEEEEDEELAVGQCPLGSQRVPDTTGNCVSGFMCVRNGQFVRCA